MSHCVLSNPLHLTPVRAKQQLQEHWSGEVVCEFGRRVCRKGNDELLGMSLGSCSVTADAWYMEGDSEDGVALVSCVRDIRGVIMSLQYYSQASQQDNGALKKEFASI